MAVSAHPDRPAPCNFWSRFLRDPRVHGVSGTARAGIAIAPKQCVAVKSLEDLKAYELAVAFKLRVYATARACPAAERDHRYIGQLFDAASSVEANIAEGWRRFVAREMSQFLRYALASLEEAKRRLRDGIHRGYFTEGDCEEALTLANRCGAATMALWKSLQPFAKSRRSAGPRGPRDRGA